ncbi:MAG TPA: hypothetical protein VGT02_09870 [Methylomirabilota bacterium]|jgi:hypothetical protein|nr:hypothetical protein [Methylomirabilota bacterium]
MLRLIGAGGLVLAFGVVTLAWADPGQSANCGDHIHVKGHVRDAQGGGVSGATPFYGEGPIAGGGASAGKDLPFLVGMPSGCLCNFRQQPTAGDGSFDLKIEVSPDPRCTSAVDRVTVDKTKLYWRKQGVTIVPAP